MPLQCYDFRIMIRHWASSSDTRWPGTVAKFSSNTGHTLNISRERVSTGQEVVRTGRSHLSR